MPLLFRILLVTSVIFDRFYFSSWEKFYVDDILRFLTWHCEKKRIGVGFIQFYDLWSDFIHKF